MNLGNHLGRFFFAFFISVFVFLLPKDVRAQSILDGQRISVLVKFRPIVPMFLRNNVITQLKNDVDSSIVDTPNNNRGRELEKIDAQELTMERDKVSRVMSKLSTHLLVEYVEPNFIAEKLEMSNDPSLKDQWGLYKINVASQDGNSAWNITHGNREVLVAVLDTGVDKDHPDLSGVVTKEQDFTGSVSGPDDRDGHGTHIAGSIGAVTNNNVGIAGIARDVSIINGKVLGDDGYGTYSAIASGILWAADNGAKVINMSLGGQSSSKTLEEAVNYAKNKKVVVVAAAGNSGTSQPFYPAYYSPVVAVGAVNQNDQKPSWSNWGSWVDIAAPGHFIYSTVNEGGYAYYSGTSMATSYVSGVAALVWSLGTCQSENCVVNNLYSNAVNIQGTGSQFKYGRVDALKSVMAENLTPTLTPIPTVSETVTVDPTLSPTITPTSIPTLTIAPTLTSTPTPTPTMTPTPTVVASYEMTVDSINMWFAKRFGFIFDIYSLVTVVDEGQKKPVSSASVKILITSPSGLTYRGVATTNSNGQITLAMRNMLEKGTYKSCCA